MAVKDSDIHIVNNLEIRDSRPGTITFNLENNEEVLFFSTEETRVFGEKIEEGPNKARQVYEGICRLLNISTPKEHGDETGER